MLVELGNQAVLANGALIERDAPSITQFSIPDHYTVDETTDVDEYRTHLYESAFKGGGRAGITRRPNDEALLVVTHAGAGAWGFHSAENPTWVSCPENPVLEAQLAAFYGCPAGKPADADFTHYSLGGGPGEDFRVPKAPHLDMLLVNSGRDRWAQLEGGGPSTTATAGTTGTATSTSTSSLTNTGASWTVNAYTGMIVFAGSAYGIIESNSATVLTIDRWYAPGSPGGAAASTPSGTSVYVIAPCSAPAMFVGLSTTNSAPAAGDTTMAGEIINGTPSGENNTIGTLPTGLLRQIAPWGHTAGANTYTLTPVYTVNSNESGALPLTIYRIGCFISIIQGWSGSMFFETSLSASATVSAVGDQLTVTETVTGS